jgi:hypothetical protein
MARILAAVNDPPVSRIADEAVFLSRENESCSHLLTVFELFLRNFIVKPHHGRSVPHSPYLEDWALSEGGALTRQAMF